MASAATQKGRLRQQLLNSEMDINGLNEQQQRQQAPAQQMPMGYAGGAYQQPYDQGYPQQYGANAMNLQQSQPSFLSSYESLGSQGGNGGGIRKASLTSQSSMSMNKFFRRNKGDGGFDEDMGADINDLTNGSNVSFDDISHIRDRGPYGVNGPLIDSTPFIPTLGAGIGSASGRSMNNIQYRKQMNHQKKMAFASNARAMSLAGSNPMQQQGDPRAMSLTSYGAGTGPRTMSLNSNMAMSNGPRAMSLNNRGPFPPQMKGVIPQNGPRAMSLRNNGSQFANGSYVQGQSPGDPRTMSLTNGPPGQNAMLMNNQINQQHPQQMQQMYQQKQLPNQQQGGGYQYTTLNPNARAMSLNGGANPMSDPRFAHQGAAPGQFNRLPPHQRQNMPQMMPNGPNSNMQHNPNMNVGANQNYAQKSNDSLMNVLEEEEENNANSPKENQLVSSTPRKQNGQDYTFNDNGNENDGEDVVYKFDENDEASLLSRKSTIKKSNSMKLRKLNLFSNENRQESDIQETSFDEVPSDSRRLSESYNDISNNENEVSPSFNLRKAKENRQSLINDELSEDELAQKNKHHEMLHSLGANAENTGNKDVFVTASEFESPKKSENFLDHKKVSLKNRQPEDIKEDDEDNEDSLLKGRGSPISNTNDDTTKQLSKQPSIKSLVTNTAFDNFRDPSRKSSKTLPGLPGSPSFSNDDLNGAYDDINLEQSLQQPKQMLDETSNYSSEASLKQPKQMLDETSNYSSEASLAQSQVLPNQTVINRGDSNPEPFKSQYASNQSIDSNIGDGNENSTPPTTQNSNLSNTAAYYDKTQDDRHIIGQNIATDDVHVPDNEKQIHSIRNMNTSDMLSAPFIDENAYNNEQTRKERRSSKTFSIGNKSKNIFKRFSKSGKKGGDDEDTYNNDDSSFVLNRNSIQSYNQSGIQSRKLSSASIGQSKTAKPLKFTKEELGIMNCNNELLNELQLVTTELASSIKRELEFESKLKNKSGSPKESHEGLQDQLLEKSKIISDLQEKLNKERSLRFICEEHALLAESGTSPSPLKLNYEKTELYKQLLIKNDTVNQLQDKIEEFQNKNGSDNNNLLLKYNELLEENTNLKSKTIPDLESRLEASQNSDKVNNNKLLNLVNNSDHGNRYNERDYEQDYDEDYDQSNEHIEISTLKNQRDELREVVSKLTSSYNYELKLAQEKIKNLELKVQDMNSINNKLSQRLESNRSNSININNNSGTAANNNNNYTYKNPASNILGKNKGGKLQGFAIVSPTKKLFDD